jgi:hypothetical protein
VPTVSGSRSFSLVAAIAILALFGIIQKGFWLLGQPRDDVATIRPRAQDKSSGDPTITILHIFA